MFTPLNTHHTGIGNTTRRAQREHGLTGAKYDITSNYQYIRAKGAIPIIDYNRGNEKLTKQHLLDRGYDQNGWPFAPCQLLTRPNGFDHDRQRLTFCCFKACLCLKHQALASLDSRFDMAACPHINNANGFVTHTTIKDHPRLTNEIPRGSKRYDQLNKSRSASERANSTLKEDLHILDQPKVINRTRANILACMATIVLLLYRGCAFIVHLTYSFRKFRQTNDPKLRDRLKTPSIAKSIRNLIQLE